MSNENPIISFAILAWNRSKEIKKCLDSLIKQILETNESIEIYVSDDASTDETPIILEEYHKKYKFVNYYRNEKNLGFDLNMINAIEKSSGEYVWIFGDDDILADGSLNKIISIIKNNSPSYISTNYDQFIQLGNQMKKVKMNKRLSNEMKKVSGDLANLNFKMILKLRANTMLFMSSDIILKKAINLEYVKNNINKIKLWDHLYMIAQATIKGGGYITPCVCVHCRVDNSKARYYIFTKLLPNTYDFIFNTYQFNEVFRRKFFKRCKKFWLDFIHLAVYLKIANERLDFNNIDPRLYSYLHIFFIKIILPIIPRKLIILGVKVIRFYKGKGFTQGPQLLQRF